MSLVNKIFGRGHGKSANQTDRLASDRARQASIPATQSLSDQAAIRVRMEEELAQARAKREGAAPAAGD